MRKVKKKLGQQNSILLIAENNVIDLKEKIGDLNLILAINPEK